MLGLPDTEDPVLTNVWSRVVVDLFGVEGADDAELISNATNMFEKGANVFDRFAQRTGMDVEAQGI